MVARIDPLGDGYQAGMLIFQMLDELAKMYGYKNGAQDLIGEEPATNKELLDIVYEELAKVMEAYEKEQEEKRRLEAELREKIRKEILAEMKKAYQ
jgi:FixJ family two-component response regulator